MASTGEVQPDSSYKMGVEDAADHLYRNKVILAPMVRAGTLPFRALALRYGADTVFTEEIIDRRVVNAVRTENPVLGTVDYVEQRGKKGTATPFQTCAMERERVVYQIGTGDATNALRAAQHVERDVAGVDVNMGCPKRFSLQGCMGAALLKRPEIAADIVGTLRRNLSVPVSAKIRLLSSPSETVEFARRMEKAGACALTVHVRQVEDKPASKARWEELRAVVDAVNIPVIANGDVYTRADMANIKALSGCSSVMLARPALFNCSIFKPDGKGLPLKEVIQQYLRECFRYDSIYQNAKYTVMEMLTKRRHPDHLKASLSLGLPAGAPGMREVTPAKTLRALAMLWDVGSDYDAESAKRRERATQLGGSSASEPAERSCMHKFDDAYFLEPASDKAGMGSTPAPTVASNGGGGGGGSSGEVAGEVMAATKALPEMSDDNPGVVRVEVPSEVGVGVQGGEACLNGIGGTGREGEFCERGQAERRADCGVEGVVTRPDPGVIGGGASVSGGVVGAGVDKRRDSGACVELGLGDSPGDPGSGGQVLAATDKACDRVCSKRPRKEEGCVAL